MKLAAIEIQVLERHDLRIEATAAESVRSNVHFLTSRKTHIVFSERHDLTVENYETPNPEFSDVEWHITKPVHLPRSMDACSQTIRLDHIRIVHFLTTTIELQALDGVVSTVCWQIWLLTECQSRDLLLTRLRNPFHLIFSCLQMLLERMELSMVRISNSPRGRTFLLLPTEPIRGTQRYKIPQQVYILGGSLRNRIIYVKTWTMCPAMRPPFVWSPDFGELYCLLLSMLVGR